MTDLIERLREWTDCLDCADVPLVKEAADEIERLTAERDRAVREKNGLFDKCRVLRAALEGLMSFDLDEYFYDARDMNDMGLIEWVDGVDKWNQPEFLRWKEVIRIASEALK